MKIARFTCYGCRHDYTHIYYADCRQIECPCGQWNIPPTDAQLITGRCGHCTRPVDDHTKGKCP